MKIPFLEWIAIPEPYKAYGRELGNARQDRAEKLGLTPPFEGGLDEMRENHIIGAQAEVLVAMKMGTELPEDGPPRSYDLVGRSGSLIEVKCSRHDLRLRINKKWVDKMKGPPPDIVVGCAHDRRNDRFKVLGWIRFPDAIQAARLNTSLKSPAYVMGVSQLTR